MPFTGFISALVLLACASARATTSTPLAKIDAALLTAMHASDGENMLPIIIKLQDRASADAIRDAAAVRPKTARRRAVIGLLKTAAERSQQGLLDRLAALQPDGLVGVRIVPLWIHNVVAARATVGAISEIARRRDVAAIRLDVQITRAMIPVEPSVEHEPGDPGLGGDVTCGLELVHAPQVWDQFDITGRGSVVCVIDSGCCIGHPDLRNQIWINDDEVPGNGIDDDENGFIDDVNGWNFADGGNNNVNDVDGHGTHVAGTVAGDGTSGTQTGMAPDASLVICRYWSGEMFETTVWQAMQYAVDNGAHAITGSIGLFHRDGPDRAGWRTVSDNVIATGVVVLFAAGNAGQRFGPVDNIASPADVPDVIAVGATDCSGGWIKFSSVGPTTWEDVDPFFDWPYPPGRIKPDLAGPGLDTRSTGRCTGYSTMSGTSMATPHVAGAVALVLEANPNLDHFGVRDILQRTAFPDGGEDPDNFQGAGLLDAFAAVELALTTSGCTREPAWQCDGDVDGDGQVNPVDSGLVQSAFCASESCTDDALCQFDLDCDGQVNPVDAGIVQSLFGTCDPPRDVCP